MKRQKVFFGELEPTLWIGKKGVNDAVVDELQDQLKLRKIVKVRILKAALLKTSREEIAQELSQASGATLLDLKGATAVYRSPHRTKKTQETRIIDQRK